MLRLCLAAHKTKNRIVRKARMPLRLAGLERSRGLGPAQAHHRPRREVRNTAGLTIASLVPAISSGAAFLYAVDLWSLRTLDDQLPQCPTVDAENAVIHQHIGTRHFNPKLHN